MSNSGDSRDVRCFTINDSTCTFWSTLVVFEAPEPSNVHVGALGLSCETRGPEAAWASHNSPSKPVHKHAAKATVQEPTRAHVRVLAFQNTTKIQREDTQ